MKLKEGDLFSVPIDTISTGFGQIVAKPNPDVLIISIFDLKVDSSDAIDLQEISSARILFLGYSLDAKLHHKHWKLIGNNKSNLKDIKLPYNKLGTPPGDIFITDYKGSIVRAASLAEFDKLDYMTVVAPVRYENALKAYFGSGDWKKEYESLKYDKVKKYNKIVT